MLAEASPETIDANLREARSHLQNARLAEAEALCVAMLKTASDNIDALYTLAVTQRMQRHVPAALITLDRLIAVDSGYGRAWQERGHCFRDAGRIEDAVAAYKRAVTHNGALVASWRILSELHDAAGREGPANFALLGFQVGTFGGADTGVKIAEVDVSTQLGAQIALTAIYAAIEDVSSSQARSGAFQNRLEAVVSVLGESSENMSAARSRITDTDYAQETTALAKAQIVQQAATAMLAQANQQQQSVLALLQ